MTCTECGAPLKVRANQTVAYTVAGLPHVTLKGIEVRTCANGHHETAIPRVTALHTMLAAAFAQKRSRLAPEEIRFLRRHLGYAQTDFAKRMGVASESVSRWESGAVKMADTAERLLRLMIVTQAPIADYSLDALAALTKRDDPAPLRVANTNHQWAMATA